MVHEHVFSLIVDVVLLRVSISSASPESHKQSCGEASSLPLSLLPPNNLNIFLCVRHFICPSISPSRLYDSIPFCIILLSLFLSLCMLRNLFFRVYYSFHYCTPHFPDSMLNSSCFFVITRVAFIVASSICDKYLNLFVKKLILVFQMTRTTTLVSITSWRVLLRVFQSSSQLI